MAAERSVWIDPVVRIVTDLLSIFLVFLPWIVLKAVVYPYKRGFFCDDQSLMHPYHESTISTTVLVIVGGGVPIIAMIAAETSLFFIKKRKTGHVDYRYLGTLRIHPIVWSLYIQIGIFLFGLAVQQTITNIGKYYVGRLRPHFFSVCQPAYSKFNCTDARGIYTYVEKDVCTGKDQHKLKEMRMSFPSGHSSMSMYCAVYLVLYLQSRLIWRGSKLLRPFLQVVALYMGITCCVSRISDYKHHWSDVLIGGLLGVGTALMTVFYISNLLRHPNLKDIIYALKSIKGDREDRASYGSPANKTELHTVISNSASVPSIGKERDVEGIAYNGVNSV